MAQVTCLRCGHPAYTHILFGYVCPSCRQVDETRRAAERIAWTQAQDPVHYQEVEYDDSGYEPNQSQTPEFWDVFKGTMLFIAIMMMVKYVIGPLFGY